MDVITSALPFACVWGGAGLAVNGRTRGRRQVMVLSALRSVGNDKPVCRMVTNAKFDNPAGQ